MRQGPYGFHAEKGPEIVGSVVPQHGKAGVAADAGKTALGVSRQRRIPLLKPPERSKDV